MPRRVAVVAIVLALTAPVAPALAQGTPFSPLPPAPPAPLPAPPDTGRSASSDGGGLAGWQTALIFVAGAVLLLGIGYGIVLDARAKSPARQASRVATDRRERELHRERARRQARRKQKSARAQRKRNR
jgi:hypothetical protein